MKRGAYELIRHVPAPHARAVTSATVGGRPVLVTNGPDRTLVLHDVSTGDRIGEPLAGHTGDITLLDVTHVAGRPVLVSYALDNEIRVWDLAVHAAG